MAQDAQASEIQALEKKFKEQPESLVFVSLADAYRRAGQYEKAVLVCQEGLKRQPGASGGRVVLGRIYLEQGKLEEAEKEFRRVLEEDAENLMAHTQMGLLLLKAGRNQEAIDAFQKVLTLNPDDENVQEWLKQAIEKAAGTKSQPAPSREKKPPAQSREQESEKVSTATLTMAELYVQQGHFDKAAEVYQELLAQDPENLMLRQKLAEVVEKQEQGQSGQAAKTTARKILKDDFVKPPDQKEDSLEEGTAPAPWGKKREAVKFTREDILQVMMGGTEEVPVVEEKTEKKEGKEAPQKHQEPVLSFSEEALKELAGTENILGCALLNEAGNQLWGAGRFGSGKTKETEIAVAIFQPTRKSVERLRQGGLRQVLVTAEQGQFFLVSVPQGVLAVLADQKMNLGKLRLALESALRKMEKT